MKVRVTIDVPDTDRLIIGAYHGLSLGAMAPRGLLEDTIHDAYAALMQPLRKEWDAHTELVLTKIKEGMGK